MGRKAKRKRGERWMVRGRTRVEIKQERPLSEGETGERRKHIYIAEVPEKGRQRTWRRRERRSKDMSERERKDRFADRFMERQRGGELGGGGYWAGVGEGASGTVTLPPEQNSEERKI